MSERKPATNRTNKQPPRQFRITHSFPEPRPDDGDRFIALVKLLLKLGERK
jgi:hypothetical protein